ncbi:MAG: aldehyde dehydrogenase family protein, partial [Wenzhouxiangella sp.]
MTTPSYPFYLANRPVQANTDLAVEDKHSGETAYRVALAREADVEQAIAAAVQARRAMAELPSYHRRDVLQHCVDRFQERRDE